MLMRHPFRVSICGNVFSSVVKGMFFVLISGSQPQQICNLTGMCAGFTACTCSRLILHNRTLINGDNRHLVSSDTVQI